MSEKLVAEAAMLRRAGRFAEAAAAYRTLLAARPELAESWYNLGWVERRLGRYDEALEAYRRALDAGVSAPEEVHLNRAAILALLPAREEAVLAELERALALNPDFVPALLNLGNFEEDRGRREAARASYERALALDPANSLALARLAAVSEISDAGDPLVARLSAALARPAIDAAQRADLGFALGRLLDLAGEHDRAFAAYQAANQASRFSHGDAPARYDPRAHERFIDRIIDTFATPVRAAGEGASAPLFICGMFRSGSTLVERILASHSGVAAGGELELMPRLIRDLMPYPEAAAALDRQAIADLRRRYLDALGDLGSTGALVTDKRPDNFLHIGLIKTLFPHAKIIHTRRNPLDNILSLYFLHLDPAMSYALDLGDSAHYYAEQERLMAHWKALYPADIFEMDYDRLVRDPRAMIAALLDFCGLGTEEDCLSFHAAPGSVRTASVWQVREPLHQRGSGRWRKYERHLGAVRAALET